MTRRSLTRWILAGALLAGAGCASSDGSAAPDATTATSSTTTATSTSVASTESTATTSEPATSTVAVAGDVFPDATWDTGTLLAGVDRATLDAAVATAFGADDASGRVRSVVAVVGGEIVYERYHPLDGPDVVMPSWSVAKSFTSAVIGCLIGDGLLALDQPAPVPQWSDPDDPRHAITIEQLLHMASGLQWNEAPPDSDLFRLAVTPHAADLLAERPLESEPGTVFEYSTGTTAILASIAADVLGGPEQLDAYLHERILDPLGITSATLQHDQSGTWFGGFGTDMTPRDFARFGLLYLNDGVWNGDRLIPAGWVDYSHAPSPTNPAYGAQWWILRPEAFEARGLFGQIIMVSQAHDLVLVITTTQGGDADTLAGALYEAFTGIAA
ncbi:MAG: serine hydrolase [Ilumatobacteraceae bacterium]